MKLHRRARQPHLTIRAAGATRANRDPSLDSRPREPRPESAHLVFPTQRRIATFRETPTAPQSSTNSSRRFIASATLLAISLFSIRAFGQETFAGSPALDAIADKAVHDGLIPGAVLVAGVVDKDGGKILHRKAYGARALIPSREPMTADTIFDAASLTKVIATTSCVMKLFEAGKIRIADPVTNYLPEFQGGHSDITIRDLMTHFSGLRPDLDLTPAWSGYENGIHRALIDKPSGPPGVRFVYSDINFELMGEIVRRLSGKTLDQFAHDEIFAPLAMHDTTFKPPASLRSRIAPTEIDPDTGEPFRGIVHDPTSRYMGGVAGHAGLFTTASDLARFAEMMLGPSPAQAGTLHTAQGDVKIFSPATVRKFTSPNTPPDQPVLRGLGWDIDSPYSSNRGELYPIGSYGHTGFTGTSVWIDPSTRSYVILLTNVVHPHRGKSLTSFRSRVATAFAAAIGLDKDSSAPRVIVPVAPSGMVNEASVSYNETLEGAGVRRMVEPNHETLTGLDVLEQENFAPLKNHRVGLITNQTGVDREGRRNVDAMLAAGVKIAALFSPEHGINGAEDRPDIADSKDPATGLHVTSLYENGRYRLTPEMLRDPSGSTVDTLVFDIQDAGARFYTYSCTMLYAVDEAAKLHLPIYILDRPNPITGAHVEGPLLDSNLQSFVGCYAMPIRHGLTFGELATMANAERNLHADLHVIKMKKWSRGDWFDSTGLAWINPSPNMRSLNAEALYDGLAMLEAARNYSVGRGTGSPFEQIGADWIRGPELAHALNARQIPGVRVYPTRFTPDASNFKGKTIEGVRFVIINREQFSSVRLGLEIAAALQKLYPGKIDFEACRFLIGNRQVIDALKNGDDARTIEQNLEDGIASFLARRKPFLLYQ